MKNLKKLSRIELKKLTGGTSSLLEESLDGENVTWKCCWVGTDNCSVCAGYGSCDSRAEIRKC